ncbi:MAG: hypothetical protein ACRBCT_07025 [Alphaproteobacteria bacterium]
MALDNITGLNTGNTETDVEIRKRQIAVQQAMLVAALAKKANDAFEPASSVAVDLYPQFTQMAQQQQTGAILKMGDNERKALRADQLAAQQRMLAEALAQPRVLGIAA